MVTVWGQLPSQVVNWLGSGLLSRTCWTASWHEGTEAGLLDDLTWVWGLRGFLAYCSWGLPPWVRGEDLKKNYSYQHSYFVKTNFLWSLSIVFQYLSSYSLSKLSPLHPWWFKRCDDIIPFALKLRLFHWQEPSLVSIWSISTYLLKWNNWLFHWWGGQV